MCGLDMRPTIIDRSRNRPAETVTPTVAEPVQQPMPPTNARLPKLRLMRELLAEEAAAKVQNDRAQRQEAAIQKWRLAPAETGNAAFFQLGVDLRSAGMSMAEIEDVLRLEAGNARHPAERRREIRNICGRFGDRLADWLPDNSVRSSAGSSEPAGDARRRDRMRASGLAGEKPDGVCSAPPEAGAGRPR